MEFIDLKAQYRMLKNEIDKNTEEIIKSAKFIGGPQVAELEEKLSAYTGRKHSITCASGTDALLLAYMACDVGYGDAVFCPDMTFIASVEPACMLGATPIFCDIDPETYNIDLLSLIEKIEEVKKNGKLTPKAVVAVDFLGNPAKHEEISEVCKQYGLVHIEDGAQSTGSIYHGEKCGSFGDIATTSFFPSKPLGCYGDGGAVFTDDDEVAEKIRSVKVHGKGPNGKYDNIQIGVNSRLDTIQAGVLLPKLAVLDEEIKARQEVARRYNEAFKGKLQTPVIEPASVSAYAQYCPLAESEKQRNAITEALKKSDIPCLLYYPTVLHSLKAFESFEGSKYRKEANPNAQMYAERNFGLPFSPYITEEDQDLVIETVLSNL